MIIPRSKPHLIALAGAVGALVLATACSAPQNAAKGDGGGPSFIYITDSPIGDNQFLQLGKTGTAAAAEKLGGTAKTFESTDEQSRRSNIEAALGEQPEAIVLITYEFDDLAVEYAERNPDQQFVLIDSCPTEVPANLRCGLFKEYESSYLLGVEAGLLTHSDKVGTVAAIDSPFFHRWSDAFAQGARSVNPNLTDSQLFVGGDNPVGDPARSKELALTIIQSGADQVFGVTGGGNGGVFEAATQTGKLAYGVDVNQCPLAPGTIVDNAIKQIDIVISGLLTQIRDGEPGGTRAEYGLAEGGSTVTSLTDDAQNSGCVILKHPEVLKRVKQARDEIIAGRVTIPHTE